MYVSMARGWTRNPLGFSIDLGQCAFLAMSPSSLVRVTTAVRSYGYQDCRCHLDTKGQAGGGQGRSKTERRRTTVANGKRQTKKGNCQLSGVKRKQSEKRISCPRLAGK